LITIDIFCYCYITNDETIILGIFDKRIIDPYQEIKLIIFNFDQRVLFNAQNSGCAITGFSIEDPDQWDSVGVTLSD
jgi:hypothetical protein